MSEFYKTNVSLAEMTGKTGIPYPNPLPHPNITLLIVAWNESKRIGALLTYLQPYFDRTVVCVQDSTDNTLEIARAMATRPGDQVITDRHWGHGDASFQRMINRAKTDWCYVVSCDEWPSQDLLESMSTAIAWAKRNPLTEQAVWFKFKSSIDGIEIDDDIAHLRLFLTDIPWQGTLHSRPNTTRALLWPYGFMHHARSLDEMMIDYLMYFEVGLGNPAWVRHNQIMMHDACCMVAKHKGWAYVQAFPWWEQVAKIAFSPRELAELGE